MRNRIAMGLLVVGTFAALPQTCIADRKTQSNENSKTRCLAFQVYTGSLNPKIPIGDSQMQPLGPLPSETALCNEYRTKDFRVVTEGDGAIHAYPMFLRGVELTETVTATDPGSLPAKIHHIQRDLPPWIQETGDQALAQPLIQKLAADMKANDIPSANKDADAILNLMASKSGFDPNSLPAKLHRIQKTLPGWMQLTGDEALAQPLMQTLGTDLKANDFPDADTTADAVLKLMASRTTFDPDSLTAKIHRIQAELPGWVREPGHQALAQPLAQKLGSDMRTNDFLEADKDADAILKLMRTE